ncbi:MAG TPA: PKD domain-containing protein, partial [Bacteroidetes bacterium]|nr:PKD domain-containing protein [Bacteroidota bacterium]
GCVPLTINFQSSTSNAISWNWNFGDNALFYQGPSLLHTYEDAGQYSVTLTATSVYNCTNTLTLNNMIEAYALPNASFTVNPDGVISFVDPLVYFFNTSSNSVQWNWDFGDQSSSTYENPNHLYADTGRYNIELIAISEHSCSDTTYKSIYIKPDFSLYMPNAFTPNSDLVNDDYGPVGQFEGIKEYQLYIYNRWGDLVFDSKDIYERWNGKKYNDNALSHCQDGAYVWYVNVRDFMEKEYSYQGSVVLLK